MCGGIGSGRTPAFACAGFPSTGGAQARFAQEGSAVNAVEYARAQEGQLSEASRPISRAF
jgi:hypothetical protein